MLDEVVAALASIAAEGAFATELVSSSNELHLEVEGVGPIAFPISATTARKLCAAALLAPFGRRNQTLHDTRVRDTWELDHRRIKLDARAFHPTLDAALATIRKRLGLPEGGKLRAVLDKLLVYGPGQFFAPHQDSERHDEMVASLVVELPSRHEGGALVVRHGKETKTFRGARRGPRDLSLVAFYADCAHEVKPVESGYRVTLTYHLLHSSVASGEASFEPRQLDWLAQAVGAHFATPVAPPYSHGEPQRPDRLVYLLDHEYTEKGLAWSRLKNVDRLRAEALARCADRIDCEVSLALADVHENWSCDDPSWERRRSWRRRHEDEERDSEGYTLIELIESEVALRHWVMRDGEVSGGVEANPTDDEVCFTRPSSEMDPFESQHEGYMGNYGNTVDRWYHRAAVVLWPRSRDFVIRAKQSPAWAVAEIKKRVRAGRADEARDLARQLTPFWREVATRETTPTFVATLLAVLVSLEDPSLASALLLPFGPNHLGSRATSSFAALVERLGSAWAEGLFSAWAEASYHRSPRWLGVLPRLSGALHEKGAQGRAFAAWLLAREAASFKARHMVALRAPESRRAAGEDEWVADLAALLESAATTLATALRDGLLDLLTAPATSPSLASLGALVQKLGGARTAEETRALGLDALVGHLVVELDGAITSEPRSAGDWSIVPPGRCACVLCAKLASFLRDRDQVELCWPLAKEQRQHVHGVIELHLLPVAHATRRQGRPYTLVLTKQPALFQREQALRTRHVELRRWIEEHSAALLGLPPLL